MAKANLKTKATKVSFDEFLKSLPSDELRADCKALAAMMSEVTKAKPVMWGPSIVGFGDWHYVYDSGRENDWFIMGFSPRKSNITLYLCAGFEFTKDDLDALGKHACGKGCLYIKRLADVDQRVLKRLLKNSAACLKEIAKAPTAQEGVRHLRKQKTARTAKTAKKKTAAKK